MPRDLPANPDLTHLRKQAKDLLHEFERGDPTAIERFRALNVRAPKLADAQLAIARDYGFPSWTRLKAHVESLGKPVDPFRAAVDAIEADDALTLRQLLRDHAELRARIDRPISGLAFDSVAIVAAATRNNREIVNVLLDAGADINGRSRWWAGGFGVLDSCEPSFAPFLIERGATVNANAAARLDMLDALRDIVARDSKAVHARGGDGQTPLHVAASVEVAAYLLDHGADIDALDVDHESTPAQYAIGERQPVVRYLVARGCKTDILMAAALGDLELVRRHLDANPDAIRTTVSRRYFPMRNFHAGGTIYIWTLGANMSPHQAAKRFHHDDVFAFLMERTPVELQFAIAGELGDAQLVHTLLAKQPDLIDRLSEDQRGSLVSAAQSENMNAVRTMLEAGWPVDARGQHGGTALHWAAFHGDVPMAREILRFTPPLEVLDKDFGGTPLGWALHGSKGGPHPPRRDYAGVVDALLAAGAKLPTGNVEASDAVRAVIARYERSRA